VREGRTEQHSLRRLHFTVQPLSTQSNDISIVFSSFCSGADAVLYLLTFKWICFFCQLYDLGDLTEFQINQRDACREALTVATNALCRPGGFVPDPIINLITDFVPFRKNLPPPPIPVPSKFLMWFLFIASFVSSVLVFGALSYCQAVIDFSRMSQFMHQRSGTERFPTAAITSKKLA
jgi:hypothetical protein